MGKQFCQILLHVQGALANIKFVYDDDDDDDNDDDCSSDGFSPTNTKRSTQINMSGTVSS